MRLLSALPLLALALLFVVPGGAGTRAEPLPKAAIAVLDYAQILRASGAAKDIRRRQVMVTIVEKRVLYRLRAW